LTEKVQSPVLSVHRAKVRHEAEMIGDRYRVKMPTVATTVTPHARQNDKAAIWLRPHASDEPMVWRAGALGRCLMQIGDDGVNNLTAIR